MGVIMQGIRINTKINKQYYKKFNSIDFLIYVHYLTEQLNDSLKHGAPEIMISYNFCKNNNNNKSIYYIHNSSSFIK